MCGLQLPRGGEETSSLLLTLSPESQQQQIGADALGRGNGDGAVP